MNFFRKLAKHIRNNRLATIMFVTFCMVVIIAAILVMPSIEGFIIAGISSFFAISVYCLDKHDKKNWNREERRKMQDQLVVSEYQRKKLIEDNRNLQRRAAIEKELRFSQKEEELINKQISKAKKLKISIDTTNIKKIEEPSPINYKNDINFLTPPKLSPTFSFFNRLSPHKKPHFMFSPKYLNTLSSIAESNKIFSPQPQEVS